MVKKSKIARFKSAYLQPGHHFLESQVQHTPNMPNTDDTHDYDIDTPFLTDAVVSSFSGSGIGWLKIDTYRHCHPLIADWFMNLKAGRQRLISMDAHLRVKEASTSSSVNDLTNLSTETQAPIDKQKLTVTRTRGVYFKSQASIFTYGSINGKGETEGVTHW